MKNCTKNTAIGKAVAFGAIATRQLSLFDSPIVAGKPETPQNLESDQPFPLQIGYIPDRSRTAPDRFCKLIHYESNLNIPGQYTHPEAEKILRITRDWDWELDSLGRPRCLERLRSLLEGVSDRPCQVGGEANA